MHSLNLSWPILRDRQIDKPPKKNGFAIRSWGDVLAVALVVSICLGVIGWGLKLESELNEERARIDVLQGRIAELEAKVGNGILPRAEERIRALSEELDEHKEHE